MPQALLTPQFKSAYQLLNSAQRQAVDTIEGPVMVMAGPGTGKTQVLTTRIANILVKTDAKPENILALTFTDSAAKNMRDRLIKMIGREGYYVQIKTFHAFCSQVISDHGEFFPIPGDSQPITELERYELGRHLLATLPLEVLRPPTDQYYHLKTALSHISTLKREGLTPAKFTELTDQAIAQLQAQIDSGELKAKTAIAKQTKNNAKNHELGLIFTAYEQALRDSARYDFDDMIMFVLEAFRREPLLLAEYQEQLQYVLVDEYQDTNAAQNQVVGELVAHWGDQANLFVVGDPHQSIFRFQGASLENVLGFLRQYPPATVIHLDQGYRCSQLLYDTAFATLNAAEYQLDQAPVASEKNANLNLVEKISATPARSGQPLKFYAAASQDHETLFVVEEIAKLQHNGVPLDQIAILYRNNADAVRFMAALERWQIPFELEGGSNLLQQELMRQFIKFLNLINLLATPAAEALFWEVVFYDWLKFDRLLLMKVARLTGEKRLNILKVLAGDWTHWSSKIDLEGLLTEAEFTALQHFYQQLVEWRSADCNLVFLAWLEKVTHESGLLNYLTTQDNRVFLLNCLSTLFDQVKALNQQNHALKLADFCQSLETMISQGLKLNVNEISQQKEAVKLCTVHSAKGREWGYVFLVELIDGKWGNVSQRRHWTFPPGILQNQDLSQAQKNADERRLFYVGLTRAKQQVYLSYPQQIKQNGRLADKNLSLFVAELLQDQPHFLQAVPDDWLTLDLQTQYLEKMLQPPPAKNTTAAERAYFTQLVEGFKLSITQLNTYLTDPQEFVYRYLLKIPQQTTNSSLAFGNAVHDALKQLYQPFTLANRRRAEPTPLSLDELIQIFTQALQKQLLTPEDYQRRLVQGQQLLPRYYQAFIADPAQIKPVILGLEQSFGQQFQVILDEDIPLYGRIDRIDFLDAGAAQELAATAGGRQQLTDLPVVVIDYKTGAPQSLGQIEASVKSTPLSEREQTLPPSIRGATKRQLLFYRLLTQLDRGFTYQATAGRIDFVDQRERAHHAQVQIDFQEEELEDLKNLIREVMTEIRSLAFLDNF